MPPARHQYETYVRATPEQVWRAITDPEFTRQYFHGTAFAHPLVQSEPYTATRVDGSAAIEGVVEVLEPPRRMVLTWRPLYDAALAAEPPGRVEWHVEPAGEGLTRLRVVHADLAQSPLTWASVEHDWVWVIDSLKSLLETGTALPETRHEPPVLEDGAGEWHRMQAMEANNSVWEVIERPERSPEDGEEMLRRAYAAAYHWDRAARREPANAARADWLLARVHLLVGRPDLSLRHAERCLAICERHGLGDFDLAYGHEAAWRALTALDRPDAAARALRAARAVPVADAEDRAALEADLAG